MRRTWLENKINDHSDVVGASPVGAAPTPYLHYGLNTWLQCMGQRQLQDEMRNISDLCFSATYITDVTVLHMPSTIVHAKGKTVLHIYPSKQIQMK